MAWHIASSFPLCAAADHGNLVFERKSFKYFMLNWGYWVVTLALMYMVLAHFG